MYMGFSFLSFSPPLPCLWLTSGNLKSYRGGKKPSPSFPIPHRASTHSQRTVALRVPRAQTQEAAVEMSCEAHRAHSVRSLEGQQHQPQQGTNPSTVCPRVNLASVTSATRPGSVPSRGLYHFFTQETPGTYTFKNLQALERTQVLGATPMLSSCSPLCMMELPIHCCNQLRKRDGTAGSVGTLT